ncbi:MAG: 2-dehydro-3-deoxy-D-gluconate 5-dehydrogenase KduD [Rhodospirillales bacterium]|nr:2-dehydro-3-deoxy-D-gluconate 5-dehydrogenase KduD [Rhodospirillales bacterium]MBO6786182.1 2-dehydro-3-deoxy-D-gluconate 5-dehydrogenase KduD [Rhodospirillales bacterium]
MFDLSGKTAIVTGAGRGLGLAMAAALAGAGANIFGVQRSAMDDCRKAVEAHDHRFEGMQVDIAEDGAADAIMSRALDAFGGVDILINNAGIIRRADTLDLEREDWDDVIDINLSAALWLSQAAARYWVREGRGGKIINTASMLSFQGGIRVAGYTAAKSGLLGLTRLLANEWAAKGINVNAIAPGYFRTDNTQALQDDQVRNAEIIARIPAGRWGEPEDLGGAAVFLASSAADYVHGTVVAVDGGWLAR